MYHTYNDVSKEGYCDTSIKMYTFRSPDLFYTNHFVLILSCLGPELRFSLRSCTYTLETRYDGGIFTSEYFNYDGRGTVTTLLLNSDIYSFHDTFDIS